MRKLKSISSWVALVPLVLVIGFACSHETIKPDVPAPVAVVQTVHYQRDVRPIFEEKCAACHSCNDAPCQLKLTSADGVSRGASKIVVYDGTRSKDLDPTRLGIDALTPDAWRQKGFYSSLYSPVASEKAPLQASLLYRMIELGHQHPWPANSKIPEGIDLSRDRQNQCPMLDEFKDYAKARPTQGMPLAVTGLTDPEFQTLATWVAEGSVVEPSPLEASADELKEIAQWEAYLNRGGAREQLVARYLFEHLFIAHLYFSDQQKPHFFELLRSRTPSGQAIIPIATVRPNDDPAGPFFYRFRLLDETIVEKTHITYALNDARIKRYNELFFGSAWDAGVAPSYDEAARANAFATFAAIPAKARYQFMLDNAEYFVRSFIRGPVCSGQIATDVIRDQFWVMFENPATERYVNDVAYRARTTPLIGVPGQNSDLIGILPEWEKYRAQRNHYFDLRQAEYARAEPKGPGLDDLWDGDGVNHDALLTIFRNHDNASVNRGLIGAVPETLWVMDYPLLERTYYQLVVNFNVFGSVSHQLKTRLYFDLIRNEGENNFLRLLPSKSRAPLREAWYADSGKIKLFATYAKPDDSVPTRLVFHTKDVKSEFATKLYAHMHRVMGPPDLINRCSKHDCTVANESSEQAQANRALRRFGDISAASLPVIKLMPELVYLRVTASNGSRLMYSMLHNRAHSNVAFLVGEDLRLEPEKDTLTITPGVLGSYPNFMFDVPLEDIDAFAGQLASAGDASQLEAVVQHWGVRRTRPDFWHVFHDLTHYVDETDPIQSGLFDLSRYENL